MASTKNRKRLPKSVYRRRQRNLILAMIGILLVLILSLVLVIRRRGEDAPPDAPETTAASAPDPASEPDAPHGTDAPTEPASDSPVTGSPAQGEIHFSESSITLTLGETRKLQATDASEAAARAVWSSSDSSIASVTADGTITAAAPGSCTITASLPEDSAVFGRVTVTVQPAQTDAPKKSDAAEQTEPIQKPTDAPAAQADPAEPTYIQGILIANKTYALPKTFDPGVDPEAKAMFDKMQKAAAQEGLNIYISSGYRSYSYQVKVYNSMVKAYGKKYADEVSARPGYSEHQTGLVFDLNTIDLSFGNTKESKWVDAHAHEYGFIIRYPEGKEAITGYSYEPWHLRYLGVENATKVFNSGLTLEEYLGITSKYPD